MTSSSNGRASGVSSIPATSRKMVQSLKEIVNCPEHEIYAMLKECNMDPDDAVNRLLSQDPFHKVKSKREKKKENKESSESRSRGVGNSSSHVGRGGSDRSIGRSGATQFSSNEPGVIRSKAAYKKENGATVLPNSSHSASGIAGSNSICWSIAPSDSMPMENTAQMIGTADGISSSSQPSSGFQSAWMGVPGQLSMADIVKMGRPKVSSNPVAKPLPSESYRDSYSSHDPASKVSEINHRPEIPMSHQTASEDWPLIEPSPAARGSAVAEPPGSSAVYADPSSSSSLCVDRVNLHLNPSLDEVQVMEGSVTVENLTGEIRAGSASDRQVQVDASDSTSHFDDSSFDNRSTYQSQRLPFEDQEGIGASSHLSIPDYPVPSSVEDINVAVSSAAVSMRHLSLQREDLGQPPADDNPAVIIPTHLQVSTADCSHLSFGSFGSGISASFSGSFASKTVKSNLEETSVSADATSVEHADVRNPEYYGNEQLRSTSNENVDSPSSSQPEGIKHDTAAEVIHDHQYGFPSSVPGYGFENSTQGNAAAYSFAPVNSQMQSLAPFSSVMQAYTNSLPSNLLASTVQPLRETDLPYSAFLATQTMPTKYNTSVSSISGPTISMPEAVKPSGLSTPQPTPQTIPTTSIPTGPSLPQHLTVHPYSQPALPLGPFTSMFGYPFVPPSYPYMPSAFQQAYAAGNSAYHQSPAAVHSAGIKYSQPQYKSSVSVSSLPQSAAVASGYGGFGSSTSIPGNLTLNPSTTLPSTTIGFDDVISSQYKDSNHYVSLQQNEGAAMWLHGPGSRTMSAVPASTYYSFQGQNQHSGFRQGQQSSPYGALSYPNFYHSQTGVSQENQQTPSEGRLSASQGPPSQQSHQIWQHSY